MARSKKDVDKRKISGDALERLRKIVIELFSKGLFHQVGIRDIAQKAKVSPQTIYKYFGNKEALIYSCIKKDMDELSELLEDSAKASAELSPKERLGAYCQVFVSFYLSRLEIAEIVFLNIPMRNWIADPDFIQVRQLGLMAHLIQEGQKRGGVRKDADPRVLVHLLAGATHRYIIQTLELRRDSIQPETDAQELFRLLWPMLAAPSGE